MKKAYIPIVGSVADKVLAHLKAHPGQEFKATALAQALGLPFENINSNLKIARRDGALQFRLEGRRGYTYWLAPVVSGELFPQEPAAAPAPVPTAYRVSDEQTQPSYVFGAVPATQRFMVGTNGRALLVEVGTTYIEFTPEQTRQIAAACQSLS